jgi:hypothetical protein
LDDSRFNGVLQVFIPAPFLVGVELNLAPVLGRKLDEEKKWAVVALIK